MQTVFEHHGWWFDEMTGGGFSLKGPRGEVVTWLDVHTDGLLRLTPSRQSSITMTQTDRGYLHIEMRR